ncbi:MAG: DUF1926 domain-containing protein [Spirochaetes bacterium]|nr:DUF1926 domain-containing protein [Spirochaetota bacterium]
MQITNIILGTFNTMPEACSDKLFESTYQRSWRPFLSSLYKFQNVSAVLYYSGTVFQWIEEHHPEFILLLEEMAGRKQIEILGGGFFNPFFPLLQPSDKIGQIEMLTTYLRKTFGRRPTGGWLYEYSWDPSLPFVFRNAGFSYSFLPQRRLAEAGLIPLGRFGPLLTEDQRKVLYIFPTFEPENAQIPLWPFEAIVESLKVDYPEEGLFSLMLDGQSLPAMWEASGLESPDLLFEKSFAWFQKNCLYFETVMAKEWAKNLRAAPPFYLSSCVSTRVEQEGMKARQAGFGLACPIKQSFIDNEPAKRLYDKMCHVHNLTSLLRGDKARKKSAQEDLWKAQSGELFWKSNFGGLRRPEVRLGAYRSLIEAERTTRMHGTFSPGILLDDIDCDGVREILYQAADLNCYIHEKGGSVFEIDSFRNKQDLCAIYMSATGESQHSFVDAFYGYGSFDTTLANLGNLNYTISEKDKGPQKISLLREFALKVEEGLAGISLKKSYLFQKHSISADVEILNKSTREAKFRFVSELNLQPAASLGELAFSVLKGRDRIEFPQGATNSLESIDGLAIRTSQGKEILEIRSDKAFFLALDHFEDRISSSYSGEYKEETLYQGTRIRFGWDLVLEPDTQSICSLSLHFGG